MSLMLYVRRMYRKQMHTSIFSMAALLEMLLPSLLRIGVEIEKATERKKPENHHAGLFMGTRPGDLD